MTHSAKVRLRGILGLVLAIAPAFPIFQTGRYSTLQGALVTIGSTTVAVLMAWWTRPDPEMPPRWERPVVMGIVGGLLISFVVAYGKGTAVSGILRFAWIPLLRAIAVSVGICMMLSTLGGPLPELPEGGEPGSPPQPQPRSS